MESTRKLSRIKIQDKISVRIDAPGADGIPGEITALGFGGAFITTARNLPLGALLDLTLPLHDQELPIRVKAKVVHSEEGKGIGIEFQNLSTRDAERIGVYLFINNNDGRS